MKEQHTKFSLMDFRENNFGTVQNYGIKTSRLVPLYPCLLSAGSVLATPEAAEDAPAALCFGGRAVHDM